MHFRVRSERPSGSFGSWNAFDPSCRRNEKFTCRPLPPRSPSGRPRNVAIFPSPLADLADEELEQERLVGGGDRVGILDVHLVRGVVVLAAPALDREPASIAAFTIVVDRPRGVDDMPVP